MKLIITALLNAIIIVPLKIIVGIIKISWRIIKNIYFHNLDLEYVDNLDGHDFEYLTKQLLEKNGFKKVSVSQSSGDYGIDVFATKKYNYAIQCKRYAKKVGIKAIQEAKSGCEYYGYDIPVVFTNNTFSPAAIKLAKSVDVELWDRDLLLHYLKKAKLLNKSLPFYYPLLSFIISFSLVYGLYQGYSFFLVPCFISLFLFISIIFKIIKDKKKTPILVTESTYKIHDYNDSID